MFRSSRGNILRATPGEVMSETGLIFQLFEQPQAADTQPVA